MLIMKHLSKAKLEIVKKRIEKIRRFILIWFMGYRWVIVKIIKNDDADSDGSIYR